MDSRPDPVRLTRMTEAHLAATCRWLRESRELRDQVDCLEAPTEEGNAAYWRARWRDPSREDYAIVTADGLHVGNCGLCDIDGRRRKAQLWIYLGEGHGGGHGSAAVRRLLRHAFGDLALRRVFVRVLTTNERAIRFYLTLGFRHEGTLRKDTEQRGSPIDSWILGLLADEYGAGSGAGTDSSVGGPDAEAMV